MKKAKDGKEKEKEVQEGWLGHILPFELVQSVYLKDELECLTAKENRLIEITAQYGELLESMSEEDKEATTVNDAKNAFVNAEVKKAAKQIFSHDPEDYASIIIQVAKLLDEEKQLKGQVKFEFEDLQRKTKGCIENLDDTQARFMLEQKWIQPLLTALHQLPITLINELTQKVQALADKYETTLMDITTQITQTENSLAGMMGDLVGDEVDIQGIEQFRKLLKQDA